MQFHLNGFEPGDPEISDPSERHPGAGSQGSVPAKVDVLIVGCGPAGLTLAAQLRRSRHPDLHRRAEAGPAAARPGRRRRLPHHRDVPCLRLQRARVEGGLLDQRVDVLEAGRKAASDNIVRSGWVQDVEDGLSEFPHVVLNQARVHDFYLNVMRRSPTKLEPYYARRARPRRSGPPAADASQRATVTLERVDDAHQGQIETVKARYVVGCDGARSVVRTSIGRELHGDSANHAWGVMDVLGRHRLPGHPLQVPDPVRPRRQHADHPAGGRLSVPSLCRADKLEAGERIASRNITLDELIAKAQRILHPYRLDAKEVPWWSVYDIGQRLTDKFDDVPEDEIATRLPSVFIAGDACHTHSPKAGQGMNVSMQDAFNLGWKLVSVLHGRCPPALLHTYSAERRPIAKELIDFDREFAALLASQHDEGGRRTRQRFSAISSSTDATPRGRRRTMARRC